MTGAVLEMTDGRRAMRGTLKPGSYPSRLLGFLLAAGDWVTSDQIVTKLQWRKDQVLAAGKRLRDEGFIENKRGIPARYKALAGTASVATAIVPSGPSPSKGCLFQDSASARVLDVLLAAGDWVALDRLIGLSGLQRQSASHAARYLTTRGLAAKRGGILLEYKAICDAPRIVSGKGPTHGPLRPKTKTQKCMTCPVIIESEGSHHHRCDQCRARPDGDWLAGAMVAQ